MNEVRELVREAVSELTSPPTSVADPTLSVPDAPGLYAIYGDEIVWQQLGLGNPPDTRPLYVGKSERSMVRRDLKTHFSSGRTGSSTLRRSFAALLKAELQLEARPRNIHRPERPTNYGFADDGEDRLTIWMKSSLSISCWRAPAGCGLARVEIGVLNHVSPPLNLKDVETPWRPCVKAARAAMAAECKRWIEKAGNNN